jgi:hypothetical protein
MQKENVEKTGRGERNDELGVEMGEAEGNKKIG